MRGRRRGRGQGRRPGCVREQLTPAAQRVACVGGIEDEVHLERTPADRVEAELELGHNAEVAASSSQAPEEVRVFRFRCASDAYGGGHDVTAVAGGGGKYAASGK